MKFIVALALTALLAFSWSLFYPWWVISAGAFLVGLFIPQKNFAAFLAAFFALFFLWGAQAFLIDANNQHLLSSRVAAIFPLGGSSGALILVTAFVGGLVAGMAALTGSLLRKIFRPAKKVYVSKKITAKSAVV